MFQSQHGAVARRSCCAFSVSEQAVPPNARFCSVRPLSITCSSAGCNPALERNRNKCACCGQGWWQATTRCLATRERPLHPLKHGQPGGKAPSATPVGWAASRQPAQDWWWVQAYRDATARAAVRVSAAQPVFRERITATLGETTSVALKAAAPHLPTREPGHTTQQSRPLEHTGICSRAALHSRVYPL